MIIHIVPTLQIRNLCHYRDTVPASMAFVTDSNRPQPLWQPPPTACLAASGAASEVPSLLMHPWTWVDDLRRHSTDLVLDVGELRLADVAVEQHDHDQQQEDVDDGRRGDQQRAEQRLQHRLRGHQATDAGDPHGLPHKQHRVVVDAEELQDHRHEAPRRHDEVEHVPAVAEEEGVVRHDPHHELRAEAHGAGPVDVPMTASSVSQSEFPFRGGGGAEGGTPPLRRP